MKINGKILDSHPKKSWNIDAWAVCSSELYHKKMTVSDLITDTEEIVIISFDYYLY